MPVLDGWDLELDVDAVLRGQGAEPAAIRARSPLLVETAARALEEGLPLVEPVVVYHRLPVESVRHERLTLAGGGVLSGSLIGQHLAPAEEVIALLCTVGEALEQHAAEMMSTQIVYGLALDGVGSAAVEALANAACRRFELEAAEHAMQTTIPLSPGMLGWPVEQGQPEIFSLLDGQAAGVRLTESQIMIPRKSLTMVLGIGPDVSTGGRTCDYCSLRETCRYQEHYA